jgi:hypothetical protein
VIEKTFQADIDSTLYLGNMKVPLAYTFEYILDHTGRAGSGLTRDDERAQLSSGRGTEVHLLITCSGQMSDLLIHA